MKIEPTSQTKKIRIALIICFLAQILLCASPYIHLPQTETTKELSLTILDLFFTIDITIYPEVGKLAMLCLFFIIIPVVLFFLVTFERTRGIGMFSAIAGSVIGAMLLLYGIGPGALAMGSTIALLLYVLTLFLSVMGMMGRSMKNQ